MKKIRGLWLLATCLLCHLAQAQTTNNAPKPQPLELHGIENVYRLTEKVYSGSSPENEPTFAELQQLGIKTIISVDGAKPDVETAKKFGLRYVHLPIGYDKVPAHQAVKLVQAASSLPAPIYVHCHHGLHRGPAGAAVICIGVENWTAVQALDWLRQAGTSTNYAGLYQSVAAFTAPPADELKKVTDLPEQMEVAPIVDAMVRIDEHFDHLKLVQKAGFQTLPSHPDLSPAHDALQLEELFKELLRSDESAKQPEDYRIKMNAAMKASGELHSILNTSPLLQEKAESVFRDLSNSCSACHKPYRN